MSLNPLVLNFDNSAGELDNATTIELGEWQEAIRFGCSWRRFRQLRHHLAPLFPADYGCVFTGSGDYHHLSWLLLERLSAQRPVQLIICDNHPDNMVYPFGIHCGSWVYWASRLPQVAEIHVIGISSADISVRHAWENHLTPLLRRKITYWSVNQPAGWLRLLGRSSAARDFQNGDSLLDGLFHHIGGGPVYLSIDKDVLSPEVVNTNWDQGSFSEAHLQRLIERCSGNLVGADITGDVSLWRYQSRFKRWLSEADGQEVSDAAQIARWQQGQQALNRRLLAALEPAWAPRP